MRIVSLVPSVTETLSAWERTPIACTRFCERDDLEHVGGTKDPAIARIVELRPDLVVVDAEENRREDYESLVGHGLEVHVLRVTSMDEINDAMSGLAARVDAAWKVIQWGSPAPLRLRAFIPIWRRPWMALGTPTYGASLLAHLGIASIFEGEGPYPTTDLEEVARRKPDLVLAPSEPYPFKDRHRGELDKVAPTTFVEGKDLFWWGERSRVALSRLEISLSDL